MDANYWPLAQSDLNQPFADLTGIAGDPTWSAVPSITGYTEVYGSPSVAANPIDPIVLLYNLPQYSDAAEVLSDPGTLAQVLAGEISDWSQLFGGPSFPIRVSPEKLRFSLDNSPSSMHTRRKSINGGWRCSFI